MTCQSSDNVWLLAESFAAVWFLKSQTSAIFNWFCRLFWNDSAIQNAPNPGGGDLQRAGRLSPLRAQPRKPPCRGQAACRGPCDSTELGPGLGRPSAQIENTPALCPFHLQPVPEYETVFVLLGRAQWLSRQERLPVPSPLRGPAGPAG